MSRFRKNRAALLGCVAVASCVLISLSPQALAATITYDYTGTVTNATGIFAGQGSIVAGRITFDDRMLDWSADPYRDRFRYLNPAGDPMTMGATVNVGATTVSFTPTEHVASGIVVADGFHSFGCTDMEGCDDVRDSVAFRLDDYFTSVFSLEAHDNASQAIALGAGHLSSTIAGLIDILDHLNLELFHDYAEGYVSLGSWESPHDQLWFTWTGLSRVQDEHQMPVPEPTVFSLLGLGLAGLHVMRRRNKAT